MMCFYCECAGESYCWCVRNVRTCVPMLNLSTCRNPVLELLMECLACKAMHNGCKLHCSKSHSTCDLLQSIR